MQVLEIDRQPKKIGVRLSKTRPIPMLDVRKEPWLWECANPVISSGGTRR
jgi:hypothetical protein